MMRGIDVVSLLLGFVCRSTLQPALSFRAHPSNRWSSPSRALRPPQQRRRLHFLDTHAPQPPTRDCTTTALAARGSPGFLSDEAVSCFRNLGTGSTVYLVGVVHNAKRSCQMVQRVIRRVQPQVVMVEVDAHRLGLLPPGKASEGEDGLCWWNPLPEPDELTAAAEGVRDGGDGDVSSVGEGQGLEAMLKKSTRRKRQSRNEHTTHDEADKVVCEFYTAAVEAVACGARVLLGDRDFKETQRRLLEAEREDEEDRTRQQHVRPGDKTMKEATIKRRGLESTPPAVWRKMRDLEKAWRPRKFAVLMTERDKVMSDCLMRLEGTHDTAVAVVGAHHMVGIGRILETNGWRTRRR